MTSISANHIISKDTYGECSHLFDLALSSDRLVNMPGLPASNDAEKIWSVLMGTSFFAEDDAMFRNTCSQAPIHLLVLSLTLKIFLDNNADECAGKTKTLLLDRIELVNNEVLPVAQQRLLQVIDSSSDDRSKKAATKLLVYFGEEDQLAAVKNITSLDLSNESITDEALAHLRQMTGLKELNLSGTLISTRALVCLENLTALETLNLERVAIDSRSLEPLRGLESLQELSINSTEAYDDVITDLKYLTGLKRLNVSDTNVTADGVRQLRAWLPECEIVFER